MLLQLRHWLSMEGRYTGLLWSSTPIAHFGIFKEAQENEVLHCHWSKEYVTQELLNSNPHLLTLFCRTGRFFSHSKRCEITVHKFRGCRDSGLATLISGDMGWWGWVMTSVHLPVILRVCPSLCVGWLHSWPGWAAGRERAERELQPGVNALPQAALLRGFSAGLHSAVQSR